MVPKKNTMAVDHSKDPKVQFTWAIIDDKDFAKAQQLIDEHPRLKKRLGINFLCHVAQHGSAEAVDFLVANGWDVKQRDASEWTPLCWAVQRGNVVTTERLLDHGADPKDGCPIYGLAGDDNEHPVAMLDLLLARGADINQLLLVEGMPPRNALSHVIEQGKSEFEKILRDRGARLPHELSIDGLKGELGADPPVKDFDEQILNHLASQIAPPREEFIQSIVTDQELESVRIGSIPAIAGNHNDLLYTVGLHPRGIEFYVELGPVWPPATKLLDSQETAWPILSLRSLSREIINDQIRLPGFYGVLANGNPPKPLSEHTSFAGWLFAAPENDVHRFGLSGNKCVTLYQLFPLYREELKHHSQHGLDSLMDLIHEKGLPNGIAEGRPPLT